MRKKENIKRIGKKQVKKMGRKQKKIKKICKNATKMYEIEKTSTTKVVLEPQWGICSAPCVLCQYTVVFA